MIIMYCVKTKGLQGLIPYPGGLAGLAAVCVPGDFTEGWVGAVECFPSKAAATARSPKNAAYVCRFSVAGFLTVLWWFYGFLRWFYGF